MNAYNSMTLDEIVTFLRDHGGYFRGNENGMVNDWQEGTTGPIGPSHQTSKR